MQSKEDKIKDLAKNGLSSFEAEPSAGLWTAIEAGIRRRKRMVVFRYMAVAATILLLAGIPALFMLTNNNKDSQQTTRVAKKDISTPAVENQATQVQAVFPDDQSSARNNNQEQTSASASMGFGSKSKESKPDALIAQKQAKIKQEKDQLIEDLKDVLVTENIEITENSHQATTPTNPPESLAENPVKSDITGPADVIKIETTPISKPIHKGSWDLALGFGASSSVSISDNNSALAKGNSRYMQDDFSSEVAEETAYFEDIESTTHAAPLVFGLSISRNISKRWNLETGLVYSRLGTVIRASEINAAYREYKSVLNYLGVPVGIRFEILKRKSLGIYTMQSVVFEKGVSSSRITNIYKKNTLSSTETVSFPVRGIQVSSITGMGAEVDVVKQLGFYGQAGAQVFFLNASQPYNIRSAQMVWPSLQLGLRFHL